MCVDVYVDGPIMRESYVKLAVDVDQSAVLECSARAWPRPTMTWFRNYTSLAVVGDQDVTRKYRITERHDVGGAAVFRHVSQLSISGVREDDLGVYSCAARNDLAVNVTDFNLAVRSQSSF